MVTETDTTRRLAEMNDAAAFERIAVAVLRAANPLLYANLSHPGVQPGGKTVKSAFDNVGWVQSAGGARFVCAAHTTEQKDLEGKWLHDPVTVKPRKPGSKPTKPAGDLVKGITEIKKLRELHPSLAVSFALTTNRETSSDLRVSVETQAHAAGIDLDVWPVSRIAHFLDTDPIGQIIRRNHLGTPVKLMSRELLLQLGMRSIRDHLPLTLARENIRRDGFILGRSDTLVVGASGMGKTTVCATELGAQIEKGQPALVLKVEFVVTASTMDAALESELRRQEPEIELGAGEKALLLCTSEEPLMVLVEDVNRADSPGLVLNKVLAWGSTSTNPRATERLWRSVCPIWPQYLDLIEDQRRVLETTTLLRVDSYSPAEAIRAVRNRANVLGVQMDEHRAVSIAERLAQDPLLIGLYDLNSEEAASDVIHTYVDERLRIVASRAQRMRSEVVQALHQLLCDMLQHRVLSPSWTQVKSWIADHDAISLLRHIAHEGSVMRMSEARTEDALEFRHDRVLHTLLSRALVKVLKSGALPDYVTDPFFAEMVARAAVQVDLPLEQLGPWIDATPTIGAYALRLASEVDSSYVDIAAHALVEWLQRPDVKEPALSNQRYAVACVLAETTNPHVRYIVAQFPRDDVPWHPLFAASFRNGDIYAGLRFLSMHEIGLTVSGKESLIALVRKTYGSKLIAAVDSILRRDDLGQPGKAGMRAGALRLAGYLGDSSLAQAVQVCWDQDDAREKNLRSYLFAAARCCGHDPEATLAPVCDAWEALPEEPDSEIRQPVTRLAGEYVAWEFRSYTPHDAVQYLVERANTSKKLEWPITYMLRTVDHPDAVEQVARYAAKPGSLAVHFLTSDWERHSREAGRRMSSESKERLWRIAYDESEPDNVRVQMLAFWALTLDDADVGVLRKIPVESILYERALWHRARRGDRSVIPEVLKRIPEKPVHWLQMSRYFWSDSLTEALKPLLDQVAEEQGEDSTNLEYAVADALEYVEPKRAVSMLRCRWAKLMKKPLMVQFALLLTVPEAATLVSEAFAASRDPSALIKYFASSVTVKSNGKFRLFHPAQLQNLRPYLYLFSDEEIFLLWEACTKNGWGDFRTRYLEPRMQIAPNRQVIFPNDPVDTEDLDRALAGERTWYYDWLDRQVERGATREKVVATMLEWLVRHDEKRALDIVGAIVGHSATRREFQLFEAVLEQRGDAALSARAVRFDVFSRSLV